MASRCCTSTATRTSTAPTTRSPRIDLLRESGACTADAWKQHPFYDVRNFHRIVVHGSTFPLEWLKLSIDPRAASTNAPSPTSWGPFTWQRETQAS